MFRLATLQLLPVPVRFARSSGSSAPLATLGVALALLVSGCGGQAASGGGSKEGGAKAGGKAGDPVQVKVQPAREAALVRAVTVTGTLAAEDQVAMGFKVAGRIQTINVDLGSRVAPGQTIARLAPVDFQLRVQQAEAALQQARARLGLDPAGAGRAGGPGEDAGGPAGAGGARRGTAEPRPREDVRRTRDLVQGGTGHGRRGPQGGGRPLPGRDRGGPQPSGPAHATQDGTRPGATGDGRLHPPRPVPGHHP